MKRLKSLVLSLLAAAADALHDALSHYLRRFGLLLSAAHTAVESLTDTTYAISATLPATYDASGYGLTSIVYTIIGKVQTILPYGSDRSINKFQPIAGAAEKTKGSPDYGEGDMVFGSMPADAGQVIVKAAEASSNHYSLKITYPDGEIHYIDVIVAGFKYSGGGEGAPITVTAKLGVCRAPVIVAAP